MDNTILKPVNPKTWNMIWAQLGERRYPKGIVQRSGWHQVTQCLTSKDKVGASKDEGASKDNEEASEDNEEASEDNVTDT